MEAIHMTTENFEKEVLQSDIPVLIDFWAAWCGPCKMLMPAVEAVAKEANGYKVVKVNADEEPNLLAQYNVASIPTLIVIRDGKEVKRSVGLISKEEILKMLQ